LRGEDTLLHGETLLVVTTYISSVSLLCMFSIQQIQLTGNDSPVTSPFVSKGVKRYFLSHPGLEEVSAKYCQLTILLDISNPRINSQVLLLLKVVELLSPSSGV
jgi:hypothetical protein